MPCVAGSSRRRTMLPLASLMVTRMAGGSSKDSARNSSGVGYGVSPRCTAGERGNCRLSRRGRLMAVTAIHPGEHLDQAALFLSHAMSPLDKLDIADAHLDCQLERRWERARANAVHLTESPWGRLQPNAARFSQTRDLELMVGRTPWSARDAPVPLAGSKNQVLP